MKTFSDGTLNKLQRRDGKWVWRGRIVATDDNGSKKSLTRTFDVECTAPKKDESKRGKRTAQRGKGYATASNLLKQWRQELIDAESERIRQEAEEAARAVEEARRLEEEANKISVYDVVENYIDWREEMSKALIAKGEKSLPDGSKPIQPSTVRDYRHTLRRLEDFKDVDVRDLTRKQFLLWQERQIKRGVSANCRKKEFLLLKIALNRAVDLEIVENNVIASMKAPTVSLPSENNSLTQSDMKWVTSQLVRSKATASVVGAMLALHCGLRGGECCGLQWRDVNPNGDGRVHVNRAIGIADGGCFVKEPKSKSGVRQVWMDEYVVEVLDKRRALMLEERGGNADGFEYLYVLGNADGAFLTPTTLGRKWRAMSEPWDLRGTVAGQEITLHSLRHSFASALKQKAENKDLGNASDAMGHADIQTTMNLYAGRDQEAIDKVVMEAASYMAPDPDVIAYPRNGTEG